MRSRKHPLGTQNICGARVTQARKNLGMKQKELLARLQVAGIDLNESNLSKLEGQTRAVSDRELLAIADILGMPIDRLLGKED